MTTIEELMNFIESQISGYFYGIVDGYEVMYNKEDPTWRIRRWTKYGDSVKYDWEYFKIEEAVSIFNQYNMDIQRLYTLLIGSVESKGVYYKMQLERISELIGCEAVDKAEAAWKELANGINDYIRKSRIKLVED